MSLEDEIKDLQKKIGLLEDENSSLSQNMEDLLLINILNDQSVKVNNIESYLNGVLEKLSILKAIPLVAVGKIDKSSCKIISYYSLHDNYNRLGIPINIGTIVNSFKLQEPNYLKKNEIAIVITDLFLSENLPIVTEIAIFSFEVATLGKHLLILADNDASGSRLKSLEPLLNGFIENLKLRVENIILNQNLTNFNAELEEKVVERTEQLEQIIELLNSEIEERIIKEIEIAESEKLLTAIFNGAPLIMFLIDKKSRVIKINQTGKNTFDENESQAVGLKYGQILNCIHSNINNKGCGNMSECSGCILQRSIKHSLESHENTYKVEGKISMGIQGNVFERNVLVSTEYLDINKEPSVFVSIDDITERVQLEDTLKEKTLILLKAQELAKIGDFTYDIKSKSFRLSPILEKITGAKKNTVTFDEIIFSIHTDDREEVARIFSEVLYDLNRHSFTYRRFKPNGDLQHLFNQVESERDSKSSSIKIFGVVMDITDLKKTEEDLWIKNQELQATEEELTASNDALRENLQELEKAKIKAEESDRLKSAFLANMSHEIRTPMNAIMGFSDLLDMEDMPFEKRKKFTKIIQERSKDLMGIINDILDISRIESHTLKIFETKGNINDKLVEISEFFKVKNDELFSKPIAIEIFNQLKPEQCSIETDFERIKQVLINLIDNAFKFTSKGKIQIGCQLKDKNTLQFFVSDSGIGIEKDKHQVIFERFRQIEETYMTRDFGGAGLGLSISKGIVELLNGSIWVESELGQGSTFYFTVPYKSCNN